MITGIKPKTAYIYGMWFVTPLIIVAIATDRAMIMGVMTTDTITVDMVMTGAVTTALTATTVTTAKATTERPTKLRPGRSRAKTAISARNRRRGWVSARSAKWFASTQKRPDCYQPGLFSVSVKLTW